MAPTAWALVSACVELLSGVCDHVVINSSHVGVPYSGDSSRRCGIAPAQKMQPVPRHFQRDVRRASLKKPRRKAASSSSSVNGRFNVLLLRFELLVGAGPPNLCHRGSHTYEGQGL